MEQLRLGSPHGLTFAHVERAPGAPVQSALVRLTVEGLVAEHRVVSDHYSTGFQRLIDFLTDLADRWRGWDGVKHYVAWERDLQLSATHSGNRIVVDVVLVREVEGWTVRGSVSVEPGEELAAAVEAARRVLGS